MNSSFLKVTSTLCVAATLLSAKISYAAPPQQTLHIRLYDRAQIPTEKLQSAIGEATRIFKAAGIRLEWERWAVEPSEDCGLDMSGPAAPRTRPERQYLVIRILPTAAANVFPGALGFSLPFAQAGAHVEIFYDRILATARSWNVASDVALGYAMAHESGHILLRSSDHSSSGLMQATWNRATWHLASEGLLAFLPEQKNQMRQAALRFGAP